MFAKIVLIILDSLGIGELPDAQLYGDEGSNTLGNLALAAGGINLPNMAAMGLGRLGDFAGVEPVPNPTGAFGRMACRSAGKDTTTGHWEIAGIILKKPFPVYPGGFPPEIIGEFEKRTGLEVLGNIAASGTEIIKELGEEHIRTGKPIVYTSADSVLQIAAHEEVIPVEKLYQLCRTAREIMTGDHAVGRIIARPFEGKPGNFKRTGRRHDFSLAPPVPNILTLLKDAGYAVYGVGKIKDIFSGVGLTDYVYTKNNMDGIDQTIKAAGHIKKGLVFANLVEFDMLYGHRNDFSGYAAALEAFDRRLPEITDALGENDMLIITADHGCDPTTTSTDHSREYVPLLVWGKNVRPGTDLGTRETFADIGASLAEIFRLPFEVGKSFAGEIYKKCGAKNENG